MEYNIVLDITRNIHKYNTPPPILSKIMMIKNLYPPHQENQIKLQAYEIVYLSALLNNRLMELKEDKDRKRERLMIPDLIDKLTLI